MTIKIEIDMEVPILVWVSDLFKVIYENDLLTDEKMGVFQRRIFGIIRSSQTSSIRSKWFFHNLKKVLINESDKNIIIQYNDRSASKYSLEKLREKYAGDNII